jgi:hypothetical protein
MERIRLYKVEEVARFFKVREEDVMSWIMAFGLEAFPLPGGGCDLRILENDLHDFIEYHKMRIDNALAYYRNNDI